MDNKEAVHETLENLIHATGDDNEFGELDALTALETLVDKDAVVSMLEGMKEVVFFDDGRVDSVTTDAIFTALNDAIKNVEEM